MSNTPASTSNSSSQNPPGGSAGKEAGQTGAPAPARQEEKLNPVIWVVLATGAVIIDLAQFGLEALTLGTLGTVINMLADIFIGLSLATFFLVKGMLDWTLAISLILGFLVDFFSAGIMPAWSADIAYAWLVTDGTNKLDSVPVIGEQARKAALMALQKRKGGTSEAAGAAEAGKKATGAVPPVIGGEGGVSGKTTGKSVDGIKPGTGTDNGAQKTTAGSGEKPPVLSGQNSSPASSSQNRTPPHTPQPAPQISPAQSPSSPSERHSSGSDGQQSAPGDKNGDDKKSEKEKGGGGKKKDGIKDSENPENEGEKKEGGENENGESSEQSTESADENWQYYTDSDGTEKRKNGSGKVQTKGKDGKWANDKHKAGNGAGGSGASHSGSSDSHGQNHNQSSGGQSSGGSSGGSRGGGEQLQNPPRYGVDEDYAREHPFISGVDTALGVKGKEK